MSELKKQIRASTVGQQAMFKRKSVEVNGVEVEVKQPSVASRSEIMRRSRESGKIQAASRGKSAKEIDAQDVLSSINYGKMQVWAVIFCTVVPGTDEFVYSEEDFDSLMNRPSGDFVDELSQAAMDLMNVEPEEDEKN